MRKILILILSFVGLFDSLYLWWAYTSPSHPLVCLGTGCDVARASRYSHVWGLPTPFYGVAIYGVLALLAVGESLGGRWLYPVIRYATLIIAAAGFVVSLLLSGVEAFVLHAWCAWCVLSAILITLILLLGIFGVVRRSAPPEGPSALTAVRGQFVLLIVALIIGIPTFVHLVHAGEIAAAPKPVSTATLDARLVRPDSHATGDLNSPVTVVEFGDLECPMCGLAQKSVSKMLAQYGSRIRFIFRHFPLTRIHPQAEKAAEATECAAEQGKFWQAEKLFYQKQSDLSIKALKNDAAELGLNTDEFNQCLSSGKMASRVKQDIADGKALGVKYPPTFFVGHEMLVGVPNYQQLSSLIEQQLEARGVTPSSPSTVAVKKKQGPKTASAAVQPNSALGTSGGSTLGAGNIFAQVQAQSSLTCSPDEAKLQQAKLIRTPEAEKFFKSDPKALFVDVRSPQEFAAGHIPGAVNIPVEMIAQKWNTLPRNRVIVFYEGGERGGAPDDVCAFSRAAARMVLAHGFDRARVRVYEDGLKGWKAAGLPVAKGQ
ncbi:MAG: thioredoxin domain-containing protein [Terriglobia bacterium]